jgi:hypothetical protein
MSEENNDEIRQRMEERKRLTLTEGRALLDRLDEAEAEVARMRERAAAPAPTPAPPAAPAPEAVPEVPAPLREQLEHVAPMASSMPPDSVASSLHAWCSAWATLRAQVLSLREQERHALAELERLEAEAGRISHLLSVWLKEKQGG